MDAEYLKTLYRRYSGKEPDLFIKLYPAGSVRKYYRLGSDKGPYAVGTINDDIAENKAFIGFTNHFRSKNLPVPEIYEISDDYKYYLQEDLGDISLKEIVDKERDGMNFPDHLAALYQQALQWLIRFQTEGHAGLDYSVSFPRSDFDTRSILWDLNHFKYFFLKLSNVPYQENELEDDFQSFSGDLNLVDRNYFMFRDFQSRNIMIKNQSLYFIDFQGGRRGPLHYDLASLLYEARANIPDTLREQLFNYYYEELLRRKIVIDDRKTFRNNYLGYALIRQLQALGAYGLRGLIEKKPLFMQSIPYALKNLESMSLEIGEGLMKYPELKRVIHELVKMRKFTDVIEDPSDVLTVRISSFSYVRGVPDDLRGHGGGYVFDCRHIENPGKFPEYMDLTGLDPEVEKFFLERSGMQQFLDDVFSIMDASIKTYLKRDYKDLQVCFGCTGGRHRSVYAAWKLSEHLKSAGVNIKLQHREINDQETEHTDK